MAFIVWCQRVCATRYLTSNYSSVVKKCRYSWITNVKPTKNEAFLKTKCAAFVMRKRNFFGPFKKHTKDELKVIDNIPDQYSLIYRNVMDRYLLLAQLVTSVTALIVILVTIYKYDFSNKELYLYKWDKTDKGAENEGLMYITIFVGLVVILQLMVSRLPIRIYYLPQQKKYTFVFYGNYPFTQKQLSCNIGDVVPAPEKGITPWKQAYYDIKDEQRIILLDQYFRRPADLYIMLGVQRDHDADEENK